MEIPIKNKDKEIVGYALVSPEDYDNVNKYSWRDGNGYVQGTINGITMRMHQFIMGEHEDKSLIIDHKDCNKMNNTRENLRFITKSQNNQNRPKRDNCTSKYIGVCWNPFAKKWSANYIRNLGSFDTEEEAAIRYDTYLFLTYGSETRTNGLVNYEDIKDIDINTLVPEKNERDLPECIFHKRKSFDVQIKYKKQLFRSIQPTLELAIKKLDEYKKEIEKLRIKDGEEHAQLIIQRNNNGIAIIPLMNREGVIVERTTVSDDKWHECMKYSWYLNSHKYAQGYVEGKNIKLHRFIMNLVQDDTIIDHIDNNRLNNTNENLRLSNASNNSHNRTKSANATSKYFGVYYNKTSNKWKSEIRKNNERYHIGTFETEVTAAIAYNEKSLELYGEHAKLNIIEKKVLNKKV